MGEMTSAKATALRKPFPPEVMGKLPKPYKADSARGDCRECGGYHGLPALHLDYVGHAAVTDRLLTVDPEWSWEPMALDQFGSPFCDKEGNLWIKLTVCGVTRLGVGDGKNMKERIGDAIRNAAMRFGVALDLWAKENLVEFAQTVNTHARAQQVQPTDEPPEDIPQATDTPVPDASDDPPAEHNQPMTEKTRKTMFGLFAALKITEDEQLPGINHVLGTDYPSRGRLTEAEAKKVIAVLKKRKEAAVVSTVETLQGGAA